MANIPAFVVPLVRLVYDNITQLVKDTASQSAKEAAGAVQGHLTQSITDNLSSVKYNFELIYGLEGKVKNLWNELAELKCSSPQFTQEDANAPQARLAGEIRDAVFEAEDAIETYFAETRRHKRRKLSGRVRNAINHPSKLRSIAANIERITEEVSNLRQTKIEHGLEIKQLDKTTAAAGESKKEIKFIEMNVPKSGDESTKPGETITSDDLTKAEENTIADENKKKKFVFSFDDCVVGFQDEKEKVIELLNQGPKNREVIAIFGTVGLGKTTLAGMVFNDPTIDYQFPRRAFVQVSHDFRRKDVFLKILEFFTTDKMYEKSDKELEQIIQNYLEKRQYLVVLDDVWDNSAWDELKIAFPKNEKGSRILITTRHEQVARHATRKNANKLSCQYKLRFLYEQEAKELLRWKVFGEESPPDFILQEKDFTEKEILEKCAGLPLAIVVVAGILLTHSDKPYWWKKVSRGVADYDPESKKKTDELIKLSYNHLPDRLKPCFLYLGVFREDFEIPARTLFQLWVSEGFIEFKRDRALEDVAEEYLEELVGRSLVMVGNRRPNAQIKTCRIHDTLRDFCKDIAEKENLFREITRYEQETDSIQSSLTVNDRRICIHSNVGPHIKRKLSCKRVRSLLSFSKEEITLNPQDIQSIFAELEVLRVLHIRSINFVRFPLDLFDLLLLKYIAISGALKILPQDMSNLYNLQTLIVRTSSRTLEIKWDIWKNMPQFRHLDTNSCTSLLEEEKESSLPNNHLQTLSTISPESCKKEVFARTPNLKKLGVKGELAKYFGDEGQCSLFTSFQELELLENLKLVNDESTELKALPDHKNFPRNLTRLTLSNTLLDWKHMWTLGKLEKLEELKLEDNAFFGVSWETKDGGFFGLKVLHIGKTNLRDWKASRSSFPVLSHLYLKHCDELASIPTDFVYIKSLQMIDLHCTNKKVASSAKSIERTKLKVQVQKWSNRTTPFKLSVYPPDDIPSEASSTNDLSTATPANVR